MKDDKLLDTQDKAIAVLLILAALIGFIGAPMYSSYKLGQAHCTPSEQHEAQTDDRHRSTTDTP